MSQEFIFLLLALLLVFANGVFVAFEFAIVKVRKSRLEALVAEGASGAKGAMAAVNKLDSYLSASQFGITLASLGLGWLGEPAFARIIQPGAKKIIALTRGADAVVTPESIASAENISHTIALVIGFSIITFLHIVVGELAPKSLAIQKAENVSLALALPMRIFYYVFFPGIWLLNGLARKLLALFGLGEASEQSEAHNEDELRFILQSSAESGVIATQRAELLERALSMADKSARQVLVPRSQVVFLDLEETIDKNVADARASGHTWLPICRGNLDAVEGVVNVKDLFFLLSRGELQNLAQVQRPVLFVPENATLEQLIAEFRRRKRQMAIVVDEHGGTSGIVTVADVVAEVVGDMGEFRSKGEEVKSLPGGKLELPGTTELDDLRNRLDVEFELENKDIDIATIAGFLMAKLNRIPERGDKVAVGEYEIVVEEMDGPRVNRVRIQPRTTTPAPVTTPSPMPSVTLPPRSDGGANI